MDDLELEQFAEWDTAFVNDLPDSSFAYISPGGKKDSDGKTTPRSLRHLPYRDSSGSVDLPHLRNALARLNQVQGLSGEQEARVRAKLEGLLKNAKQATEGSFVDTVPDQSDVPGTNFLNRLYQRLRSMIGADGLLDQQSFNAAVAHARGHAGGRARADNAMANRMGDDADGSGEDVSGQQFFEPPDWIPYLPTPNVYTHPRYGKVPITRERNARFVANFKSGVYQSQLPVDAEHQTKLSGALGWIHDMRQNANGSVDARVNWTDRGNALLRADRFKYVSPEIFDRWQAPDTGEFHTDVAIGAAVCTRPHFKDTGKQGGLRPLAATEDGDAIQSWRSIFSLYEADEAATSPAADQQPTPTQEARMSDPQSVTMTEEQSRLFAEMRDKVAALEAEAAGHKTASEQYATALKQATESVKMLEHDARRKRFTDTVMGRGDGNDGLRWFGETPKLVSTLEHLADALGEDSEPFQQFVEQQREVATRLSQASIFAEHGSSAPAGGGDAAARVDARARSLMETDPTLTIQAARVKVYEADPKLFAEEMGYGN